MVGTTSHGADPKPSFPQFAASKAGWLDSQPALIIVKQSPWVGNILFIKSTSLFHGVHSKQTLLDICASIIPCHQACAGPAGRGGSHTASCRLQGPLGRYEQRGASLRVDSILHHCPPTIPRDTLCFHILEALQGPGGDPHPA